MSKNEYNKKVKALDKLRDEHKINRKIYRATIQELKLRLEESILKLDRVAHTKQVAYRYNKHNGEINSKIVGSRDTRVCLWS